jgi:hypothetical protein
MRPTRRRIGLFNVRSNVAYACAGVPSVPARTLSKHELQYTGRSLRGANGTTAWPPQAPQIAA